MKTPRRTWKICPACRGEGHVVNPNIDAHGISADEFREDPDFEESYRNGEYDISCNACSGTGKVTVERIRELHQNVEDRRLAAREDGDWESYSTAGDLRWG